MWCRLGQGNSSHDRRLDGREKPSSTGQFQRQLARRRWEPSRAQLSRHLSQLPGSSASPCWPRKLREAEGGGARMPMWVSAGLAWEGQLGGAEGSVVQKLPIWERVTSPGEGSAPLGSGRVLLAAPEKGGQEPPGWVRPQWPPHLFCWGPGQQAFQGHKQPSNPGRSGGAFLLPHLLAEPQHSKRLQTAGP